MSKYKYSTLGILGNPLKQSMSPEVHNYWLSKNHIKYNYCKFEIDKIKDIGCAIRKLKIKGLNVTIPFKKEIIKYLDDVDSNALKLQAVNTIDNKNGALRGYNTDIKGFTIGLNSFKSLNKKKHAVVLGAGGASEAVIQSLLDYGIKEIFLMNRTKTKAEKLAEKYRQVDAKNWINKDYINEAGIIVNSTCLGMIGYPTLPLSLKHTTKNTKVYDIVYNPQETTFIREAKINKLEYTTGLSMFFGQAQESFKIWFKIRPVIDNYITSKIKKKLKRK